MAATNYTPIQLYYSTTASAAPTAGNLVNGELAINITDGKLYYKDNGGVVQVIATKGAGTIGGSNTQIQYNNSGALAGSSAMTFNSGTNTVTLTTLNLTNALGATYGGTAQSAYAQGDLLYASAVNTLSKLTIGTVNYILTSTGSVPQWVAPTSVTVQTANNLAGGAAGSVPYQSAADTTTFLAIGAANRVMTSSGSAPQWVTSLTGLTGVSSSSMTNTSLTSGRLVYSTTGGAQTDSANLTFNGTTLSMTGLSNTGFSTIVKTVTLGDSNFNGSAVFAPATPAKLYIGTGTVTDVTSAASATNTTGAVTAFGITPIAATNTAVTYTNASTLYIAGAPTAGTNITITNPYAFYVAGGASYFGGAVDFAVTPSYSGGTANGVMYLNASKQITTGSALTFNGTNLTIGSGGKLLYSGVSYGVGIDPDGSGGFGAGYNFETNGGTPRYLVTGPISGQYISSGSSPFVAWYLGSSAASGTAAPEQMRLTSTGLGIGTSSPTASAKLELVGGNLRVRNTNNTASSNTTFWNGDYVGAFLWNQSNTSGAVAGIQFVNGSSANGNAGIGGVAEASSPTTSALAFYTGGSGVGGGTVPERMRLDSSGNLGLGTTSPNLSGGSAGSQVITVSASSSGRNGILELNGTRTTSGDYVGYVRFFNNAAATPLADIQAIRGSSDTTGVLAFATSGTERARIDSSGNLSIGGAVAQAKLNVITGLSGTYGSAAVWITDNATTSMLLNNTSSGVSSIWASGALTFGAGGNNNTEVGRFTSTGSFGVGTTSPYSAIGVTGDITLGGTPSPGGSYGKYSWRYGNSASFGAAGYIDVIQVAAGNSGAMIFATNNNTPDTAEPTERMRISSAGDVLINTSSSGGRLVIAQSNSVQPAIYLPIDESTIQGVAAATQIRMGNNLVLQSSGVTSIAAKNASGYINFSTGSGPSEYARIDSSGNFMVGTTSAVAKLDVRGNGYFETTANPTNAFVVQLTNQTTTSNNGCRLSFDAYNIGSASLGVPSDSASLAFYTNSNTTERARIDSSGNLLVGTTSASGAVERLAVTQTNDNWMTVLSNAHASSPFGEQIWFTAADPNNTTNLFLGCYGGSGQTARFQVRSNGGLANYSGNDVNLSDRREKTNFAPAKSYLETICAIPVQTFNYIDQNTEEDPGTTLGVVAQDVQAVAPELVMESNWGTAEEPKMRLSIYQTDLQYALMKCIQELKSELDSVKAELATLKGN